MQILDEIRKAMTSGCIPQVKVTDQPNQTNTALRHTHDNPPAREQHKTRKTRSLFALNDALKLTMLVDPDPIQTTSEGDGYRLHWGRRIAIR